MNFGDRLKQLRTQKSLTQPQLAQAIGIEQSYLSKLENDKSIPGADIFQSILRALQIDVASFLEGVDDNIVHRELRQVPEVANHLNARSTQRVHDVKRWLFSSAIAGVVGLTLFSAGYKELLSSNWQYTYYSEGVIHPGEPTDLFTGVQSWLTARVHAGEITESEFAKQKLEILAREQTEFRVLDVRRGESFTENVPSGTRWFQLKDATYQPSAANRYLMLGGLFLAFGSLFGFIVEWRLRSFKRG